MNRIQNLPIIMLTILTSILSVAGCLLYQYELYFSTIMVVLCIIGIITYMWQWQSRALDMIIRTIESIKYNDFSLNFSLHRKTKREQQLALDLNNVIGSIKERLNVAEARYQYYETLLSTVDSCMLVINERADLLWMNEATKRLFCHSPHLKTITDLNVFNPRFSDIITTLVPGEIKTLQLHEDESEREYAITITLYKAQNSKLRLINLKNIHAALERNEMEAWQKLISVLTHEIMNSLTPIISISETLSQRETEQIPSPKEYGVMKQSMQTIHRRSKGLLHFIENYRKLSRITLPQRDAVLLSELLDDLKKLFSEHTSCFEYHLDNPTLLLHIDITQMEQVLINIYKNAIEACSERENAVIKIKQSMDNDHVTLSIADNGCGIMPDVLDKVFVPFFTTKQSGSGIGLSLCKRIIRLHGGDLRVTSQLGVGTKFTIRLPNTENVS
ncbi:MAG: sensor histidine kinase [Marinifilaceae bacterium]